MHFCNIGNIDRYIEIEKKTLEERGKAQSRTFPSNESQIAKLNIIKNGDVQGRSCQST